MIDKLKYAWIEIAGVFLIFKLAGTHFKTPEILVSFVQILGKDLVGRVSTVVKGSDVIRVYASLIFQGSLSRKGERNFIEVSSVLALEH